MILGIKIVLAIVGSYYFTRALLTLGEVGMDAGRANVEGKPYDFRGELVIHWRELKNWPIKWLEEMF